MNFYNFLVLGLIVLLVPIVWFIVIWAYRRPPWFITSRRSSSQGWQKVAFSMVIQNLGWNKIQIPQDGHTVVFPMNNGVEKRLGITIIDIEKPNQEPIVIPPLGMIEIGTDVFKPKIEMISGEGLKNRDSFKIVLKDEWGREKSIWYKFPDTLTKAIPNKETGEWEYPNESIVLSYGTKDVSSIIGNWLKKRAQKHKPRATNIWPNFPPTEPVEPRKFNFETEATEQECVVGFIDILGFKQLMNSEDKEKRKDAIALLEYLVSNSRKHGVEIHDLGIGTQTVINPEVSTFSDNVVLSFPLRDISHPAPGGHTVIRDVSNFMTNLITTCIGTYWHGLHVGLLFRGGITVGRLYHAENVVAGKGLVEAVELERKTKWPRISISTEVLNLKDDNGQPVIKDDLRQFIIQDEDDGTYYLDVFSFHIGVWWDYFHRLTGEPRGEWVEVKAALEKILNHANDAISRLEMKAKSADEDLKDEYEHAASKWKWFKKRFVKAQEQDDWKHIWNTSQDTPIINEEHI